MDTPKKTTGKRRGRGRPKGSKLPKKISFHLSLSQLDDLQHWADREGKTISEYLRMIVIRGAPNRREKIKVRKEFDFDMERLDNK